MWCCLQLHLSVCHLWLDWWLVLESLSEVVTLYWRNERLFVCKWISVSAHICVCFEPLCCVFFADWKWVCVHLSQCTHHQEPRQGCDSSHYRLATPAWLIAGPGTAEQLHISRHTHTYTQRANFSKCTPLSNSSAVKWDYNSVCSRLPAPSTLPIYPTSPIMVITCYKSGDSPAAVTLKHATTVSAALCVKHSNPAQRYPEREC